MTEDPTIKAYFRHLFEEPDEAAFLALFAPVLEPFGSEFSSSPSDLVTHAALIRRDIDRIKVRQKVVTASGDWVSAAIERTGVARHSGKPVAQNASIHVKLSDGLIVNVILNFDSLQYFVMLGHIDPSFVDDRLMRGCEKIGTAERLSA